MPPDPIETLEANLQRSGRQRGAVFTPWPIVRQAVHTTLELLCRDTRPLDLRVLDPAVGTGRFLVAAFEFLASRLPTPGPTLARRLVTECLFGADIHPRSVEVARARLARLAGCRPDDLAGRIVAADSLLDDLGEILGEGAFHAVVVNPPWQSFSGRQASRLAPAVRRRLAHRYQGFRRWPTTHGAFLELASRLLRPGGRAAVIVPAQTLHLDGYRACRQAVARTCRLDPQPLFLGEDAFRGIIQPCAIVFLHRSTTQPRRPPLIFSRPEKSPATRALEKIERHPAPPAGTFGDIGVHTGNSARLILSRSPAPGLAPIREGRCIRPFALEPPTLWLDPEPSLPAGRYAKVPPRSCHLDVPILVRQTASRPIATRHTSPTYFRNSALGCFGIPGLDHSALVAFLNSAPAAFFHHSHHADSRQRAFPQVKVGHLQALPIPGEAGALETPGRGLEALAFARLEREWGIVERLADLLDEQAFALWQRLRRKLAATAEPWGEAFIRAVGSLESLLPGNARIHAQKMARRVAAELDVLERRWRAARVRLDRLACRIYGLDEADTELIVEEFGQASQGGKTDRG